MVTTISETNTRQLGATSSDYSLGELMVAIAAREIQDAEVVFVGMRLPLIAFVVAKRTTPWPIHRTFAAPRNVWTCWE